MSAAHIPQVDFRTVAGVDVHVAQIEVVDPATRKVAIVAERVAVLELQAIDTVVTSTTAA